MSVPHYKMNIFMLATAQGFYLVSGVTYIMFAGLVGQMLADNKLLATLPVAIMTIGTASSTIPMSMLMRRVGRRFGFLIGASAGVVSGLMGAYAVWIGDFVLFCAATLIMGIYQACTQYYRFAAIESAPMTYVSRAASFVLLGGVLSALVGPSVAVFSRDLLDPVPFAGGFAMAAGVSILAMIPLSFVRIPRPMEEANHEGARPLRVIMRQPVFIAAVLNAATSYGLMVLVMTATPLAMTACGFEMHETGSVIQWHVLAMFVPSFFTGSLIHRFGLLTILFTGMALFILSAMFAVSGIGFLNFTGALVLLGVAWNFLFVGGTTLLTEAYKPSEKAKTQGVNEFIVFASAATGSFSSGGLFNVSGWDAVNYGMAPFLVLTFTATLWYAYTKRKEA
ncbi:MFS transporter [Magnetovibrio sp. PR-2]|uniref:MFS transporter n=1 Tax=Magnetovibrio sp. PR-2 TaxID=3120356 RepID=UPI002FCE5F56